MAKRKLTYVFHNPNDVEVIADYLLEVFVETNAKKVKKAIQEDCDRLHKGEHLA